MIDWQHWADRARREWRLWFDNNPHHFRRPDPIMVTLTCALCEGAQRLKYRTSMERGFESMPCPMCEDGAVRVPFAEMNGWWEKQS